MKSQQRPDQVCFFPKLALPLARFFFLLCLFFRTAPQLTERLEEAIPKRKTHSIGKSGLKQRLPDY